MEDSIPLLEEQSKKSTFTIHKVVGAIIAGAFILFLLLTIIFAALYFGSYAETLPSWDSWQKHPSRNYGRVAVAADNVRCSEVGRNILIEGGNAVDASIAVLICLGVVNPMSSGLGGGHIMTIYNATTGKCWAVDAREVAPLKAHQNMFDTDPSDAQIGWRAIAVPGELHGMRTEYEKFGGKIPWKQLFQPSIDMLNVGVPVSQALSAALKEEEKKILAESTLSDFLDSKLQTVYKYGDVMKNRLMLRDTLRYLAEAEDPIKEFYNGSMTELFVGEFDANDGIITYDDFMKYKSIVREEADLIITELKDRFVCGPPPPSSSAITQSIIKIMESYDKEFNQTTIDGNVDILHKFVEVSKFAYAMRNNLGDIAFVRDAMDNARFATSDKFVEYVRNKIDKRTHDVKYYDVKYAPSNESGTTNVAVIDADGNAVVVTATINLFFGARVASESTGIIWNSQMDDFSLPKKPNFYGYPPSPANFIHPGKRPLSSISPLIFVNKKSKKVELAVGSAGGSAIISTVSSVASRVLTFGWDLKSAVDAPRIHNQLVPSNTVYEPSFPQQYVKRMAYRGHNMTKTLGIGEATGIHVKNQRTYASSDPRKGTESQPAGF